VTSAGEVRLRRAGPDDVEHVKRCIYDALDWSPAQEFPPYELLIEHPQIVCCVLMALDL
jgi:hypothetical protein